MEKYVVSLAVEERVELQQLVNAGNAAARRLAHARILLLANEMVVLGLTKAVSTETVRQALKKMTSSRGSSKDGVSRPTPAPSLSGAWRM